MSGRSWLIRRGRVVDPASKRDEICDVLVRDGRIAHVGEIAESTDARAYDATGLVVTPGLIDVHTHLREPGYEHKESIATGTAAAAAGGFTTVFCMPNTSPALDSVEALLDLRCRAKRDARVRVHPVAAITRGRAGQEAVDFVRLADAGAAGFSDDGDTTQNSAIMRAVLEASKELDRPIMVHCEDKFLAGGSMHEGDESRRLGLSGIPPEAEEIVLSRDLMLARLTGGWLHVCHVTTGRGADLIRNAKGEGVRVTAEVTPHHLLMSDEWVGGDRTLLNVDEPPGAAGVVADPNTKVNPPLRSLGDTRRLIGAVAEGTIDVIATDHAPHASSEKEGIGFERAAFGMSGLEFALPLLLGLVRAGHLTLSDLVAVLSWRPAQLWKLPGGTLQEGSPADLIVFDPKEQWTVAGGGLSSKSHNTPLLGMELRGRVRLTLVDGEPRHEG